MGVQLAEVHPSLAWQGWFSQSLAWLHQVGLRGLPEVGDTDSLLAVVVGASFTKSLGHFPRSVNMAGRVGRSVRLAKWTTNNWGFSTTW